jgi:2-polyprenyl-3-methyl-5-hydroxy-6-metoxy-1,4-benzoquinol methylase
MRHVMWRIEKVIMNLNQYFYDKTVKQYADEWYQNELMLPSIKEFISLLPPNPLILDLGCGPGQESMRISNNNANVVGIDFSSESISIAKERNPGLVFHCMDYFQITKDLGKFHGIFSCSSLIHNTETEILNILKLIDNIIFPNTLFCIIYRKGEGQLTTYPEVNGEKIERTVELFTTEKIDSIFKMAGYSFSRNGFLDDSIKKYWESQIFIKQKY